jgi:transcriptional regulator with XRE-family HTH domain
MSASSSSSAQAARERLARQLRDLRETARISGRTFAKLAGWADATTVSKIEKAQRTITRDHVRLWCQICGASEERTEALLAEQASAATLWVTYQQLNRRGLRGAQESVREKYERLRLLREYQSRGFPGLLQSAAWTRGLLEQVFAEQGVEVDDREGDLADAVAERMDRQSVLSRPGKRFVYVMEESAVRHRTLAPSIHADQIRHILEVRHQGSVLFGIIPQREDRGGMRPREAFIITEASQVNVELVSGYLTITHPGEVAMYISAFERLLALAVHGKACEAILRSVLDELDS